ncbi:M28 family peptidase [Sphingomicrobium sp. XHP0239]|uniref:M28 family metallopeptidase n=1 Tax=Sphingomicrobium maritimum TaxID=3133972 RepID=UPI0031CCC164
MSISRHLLPAAALASLAACAPVADPAATPSAAIEPATGAPGFLLTVERSTPEQRAAARDLLLAEFARLGIPAQARPYATSDFPGVRVRNGQILTGANVVATLPATTDSARHIVLGAHFDTVPGSPGVDDNGSGVQIVLSVAKALAALDTRDATIHFVFFDQEELGLIGAQVNAARWKTGTVPLEAMHNIDMIGWDSDDDGVIEFDSNSAEVTALYQRSAEGLPVSLLVTTYPNTDHEAYRRQGFAVASISEEFEDGSQNPDYHQPGDTEVELGYFRAAETLMIRVFTALVAST